MSDKPLVCLTLDDGPTSFRPRTLEVLRELEVPAAFFEVGMRVRANPRLTRFAAADSHQVLNHSYTHPALPSLSALQVAAEVLRTADAIADAGVRVPFLGVRPPMLAVDDAVRAVFARLGHVEVGGTISAGDWNPDTSAEQIRDNVLGSLEPGSVVVLHDGPVDTGAGSATVDALPEIVAGARELGFDFGLLTRDGEVVPATYLSSGQDVPEIVAPVPYRPLLVPDPTPPDPWVPVLDGARDAASLIAGFFDDLREQGDVGGHLTQDVVWSTQGSGERVRGQVPVADLVRALHAQMSDPTTSGYVFTDERALVEGQLTVASGPTRSGRRTAAAGPGTTPATSRVPFAAVFDIAPDGISAVRLYLSSAWTVPGV